jgi:TolA-binding protein
MNGWRARAAAAALAALVAAIHGGCWGQAFFRAPGETLASSSKIDSLLRENALLRERILRIEESQRREEDRGREANARLKTDLEELKDQLNSVAEMLREAQEAPLFKPAERRRTPPPDTTKARSEAPAGNGGAPVATADEAADTSGAAAVRPGRDDLAGAGTPGRDTAGTGTVPAPPPEELYRQIYLDYSRREYALALEESDAFLAEYPEDPLVQEILFLRGQSLGELGRPLDALKEFSTLLQRFPGGKRAPGALLRMAISYEGMGQLELAAGVARRLVAEHPRSSEAKTAEERFSSILQQ